MNIFFIAKSSEKKDLRAVDKHSSRNCRGDYPKESRMFFDLILHFGETTIGIETIGRVRVVGTNALQVKCVFVNDVTHFAVHMLLRQILTIKSHDRGKRGYFSNHKVISYHLQLTRGAQPPGQLSLYLLNDINSL